MPPLKCPECGSDHVVEAVAEWSARSLEPTDSDNSGILVECQCADCGRSLWLGDDWFAPKAACEPGACILTPENIHTADDCTMRDHGEPGGLKPMRMAKIFYSDGSGNARPDRSVVPGWYFQLNMGDPVGPFRLRVEAEAELRFVARDLRDYPPSEG